MLRLVSKRQPDPLEATTRTRKPTLTVLKLRRDAGAESPSGVQPAIQPFLSDLAAMLAADVLRNLALKHPRLRLRHRPAVRVKPQLVLLRRVK